MHDPRVFEFHRPAGETPDDSQLESQKDRATDSLVTVAQALRQTGQHLRQQEQGAIAGYARRNPGVFLGAALAIGFVGARLLKSSGASAIDALVP